MIDYSFIRFKSTLEEALEIGNSPAANLIYSGFVQISPSDTICQLTNFSQEISISSSNTKLLDTCGNVLKDISANFFFKEVQRDEEPRQIGFELIAIGEDFYDKDVLIHISGSRNEYYSNPFRITDYRKNETTFFEYKNYCDFMGIPYEIGKLYQSIRLKCYYDIPSNPNEFKDYFQISSNTTISSKSSMKSYEKYKVEEIEPFTYKRLSVLLAHDIIYCNGRRITNKAAVKSKSREGTTNFFRTSFEVAINENDLKDYSYQIYEGIKVTKYEPYGYYLLGTQIPDIRIEFNVNVEIGEGALRLRNSSHATVQELDSSLFVASGNVLTLADPSGTTLPADGHYYFLAPKGFIRHLGNDWKGINSKDEWWYEFNGGYYDKRYYDSRYYHTN